MPADGPGQARQSGAKSRPVSLCIWPPGEIKKASPDLYEKWCVPDTRVHHEDAISTGPVHWRPARTLSIGGDASASARPESGAASLAHASDWYACGTEHPQLEKASISHPHQPEALARLASCLDMHRPSIHRPSALGTCADPFDWWGRVSIGQTRAGCGEPRSRFGLVWMRNSLFGNRRQLEREHPQLEKAAISHPHQPEALARLASCLDMHGPSGSASCADPFD
jgi:hypothetical protein